MALLLHMSYLFTLLLIEQHVCWVEGDMVTDNMSLVLSSVKGSLIYILHSELFCFRAFCGCLHCNDGTSEHGQVALGVYVIKRHSAWDNVPFLYVVSSHFMGDSVELVPHFDEYLHNSCTLPSEVFLLSSVRRMLWCGDYHRTAVYGNTYVVLSNTSLIESSLPLIPTP